MIRAIGRACAAGVAALVKALPDMIRDAVALTAVAAIAYGAWLIYAPAGFIVGGALVLIGVIVTAIDRRPRAG